jgi:hypothetical protein
LLPQKVAVLDIIITWAEARLSHLLVSYLYTVHRPQRATTVSVPTKENMIQIPEVELRRKRERTFDSSACAVRSRGPYRKKPKQDWRDSRFFNNIPTKSKAKVPLAFDSSIASGTSSQEHPVVTTEHTSTTHDCDLPQVAHIRQVSYTRATPTESFDNIDEESTSFGSHKFFNAIFSESSSEPCTLAAAEPSSPSREELSLLDEEFVQLYEDNAEQQISPLQHQTESAQDASILSDGLSEEFEGFCFEAVLALLDGTDGDFDLGAAAGAGWTD